MAHENQAPFDSEPPPADPAGREAAPPDALGPAPPRDLPPADSGAPAIAPETAALPAPADLYGRPEPARPPGSPPWPAERGLFWWLVGLLAFGVGGVVLGQQELAALVAVSGLFVAAQAADHDSRWAALYYALSWVVPAGAAMTFVAVTVLLYQGELPGWPRWALIAYSCASIVACAAMVWHPVSDRLVRRLFRTDRPTHSLRLSARLVA